MITVFPPDVEGRAGQSAGPARAKWRKVNCRGLEPDEARSYLAEKDKSKRDKRMSLSEAVERFVHDGDDIGLGGFVNGRQPIALIHEIARQGRRDLTLSFQSGGLAVEYLPGAMALEPTRTGIKRMEFGNWAHEAFGLSPLFRHVAERG
ncbi:MAG TPA: CoA-transferase [Bacillota bacterium]|jgi:glutaconate CoA-transferase subunit A